MEDKTYVPGMNDIPSAAYEKTFNSHTTSSSVETSNNSVKTKVNPTLETPVVGFLYSISRKGIGEYWPIYLGQNTIGRSSNNDVQLKEGTISDMHACLSVKRMRSTGRLIASIRDVGSKTGIYLNDEELDYDNHSCKNGDLLTIGSNYQLLIMLVETDAYGLKIAENFIFVDEEQPEVEDVSMQSSKLNVTPPISESPINNAGFNPYSSQNRRFIENETVDLNGSGNSETGGGTQFM